MGILGDTLGDILNDEDAAIVNAVPVDLLSQSQFTTLEQITARAHSIGSVGEMVPRVYDPAEWYIEPTHFTVNSTDAVWLKQKYLDICCLFNIEAEEVAYYPYKLRCTTVCDAALRSMEYMTQILYTQDKTKLIVEFQRREGDNIFFNLYFHHLRKALMAEGQADDDFITLAAVDAQTQSSCVIPSTVVAAMPSADLCAELNVEPLPMDRLEEEWNVIRIFIGDSPAEGLRVIGSLMNQNVPAPKDIIAIALSHRHDVRLRTLIVQVVGAAARHESFDFTGMKDQIMELVEAGHHDNNLIIERQLCRMIDHFTTIHYDVMCGESSSDLHPIVMEFLRVVVTESRWPQSAKIATAVLDKIGARTEEPLGGGA